MLSEVFDQLTQKRFEALIKRFTDTYGRVPEVAVRSPGRAEILGNHTDYNEGYALAAAISRSIIGVFAKRSDKTVRIRSDAYPDVEINFSVDDLNPDQARSWGAYPMAVFFELAQAGFPTTGVDIFLNSDLPFSGGISSSAAYELAIAAGLQQLFSIPLDRMQLSLLCKQAENGPFVRTPCGFLDQAAVGLSESNKFLLLDFRPVGQLPVKAELIPAELDKYGFSLVIAVDYEVKRNLGETGYPARRAMCEKSVPIIAELLAKPIKALRDVSVAEYEKIKSQLLIQGGEVMLKRVEHIVYENDRVLRAVDVLHRGDMLAFGKLMSESGRSALELYELDERTPELTSLVDMQRNLPGVVGVRNMGGGFSAISLAMVHNQQLEEYQEGLRQNYQELWQRPIELIVFKADSGTQAVNIS